MCVWGGVHTCLTNSNSSSGTSIIKMFKNCKRNCLQYRLYNINQWNAHFGKCAFHWFMLYNYGGGRGGADKSLTRPTSRCRMESIVFLERRVCSCQIASLSCYGGWKEACQVTRTRQGAKGNSRYSDRNIGEHAPSYATVKNWVAQFKCGDFSTCDAPRPGRPKTVIIPESIDQIHELILEDRRISVKSIASNWASHVSRLGPLFMKIWTCGSSPRSGSRNAWTRIKNVNGTSRLSNFWIFLILFLSGLQKLQQWLKKCIELRGECVE